MEYLIPGVVGICCLIVGVIIGIVSVRIKNAFSSIYNEISIESSRNKFDTYGLHTKIDDEILSAHSRMDAIEQELSRTIDSRCDSLAHKIKRLFDIYEIYAGIAQLEVVEVEEN